MNSSTSPSEALRIGSALFATARAALRAQIQAEGITELAEIDRQVVLRDYGIELDVDEIRRRAITRPRTP